MPKIKEQSEVPEVERVTLETREGGSITITPEPQPEADDNA